MKTQHESTPKTPREWQRMGRNFRRLREAFRPRLSRAVLARRTDLDSKTIERFEKGTPIAEASLRALVFALGLTFEMINGELGDVQIRSILTRTPDGAAVHNRSGAHGAPDNVSSRGPDQLAPGTPDASTPAGETKTVAFAGGAMQPWYCPKCGRPQDADRNFCPWDGTARPLEMSAPFPLDPPRPAAATDAGRAKIPSDEEIARRVADLDDADAAAARPEPAEHAAEPGDDP